MLQKCGEGYNSMLQYTVNSQSAASRVQTLHPGLCFCDGMATELLGKFNIKPLEDYCCVSALFVSLMLDSLVFFKSD